VGDRCGKIVVCGQPEKKKTLYQKNKPDVVHVYNPSYLGNRGRRIMFLGCPGQMYASLSEK
jgi:hypothetical protein